MPVDKVRYLQCLRGTDATPKDTMPWVQLPHCNAGAAIDRTRCGNGCGNSPPCVCDLAIDD